MREEFKIERKEKLLAAAAAVFSEKGYAGSTIMDVAARTGFGKGTVYGYFSSKEELFYELFGWYAEKMVEGFPFEVLSGRQSAFRTMLDFTNLIVERMIESIEMYPLVLEFWSASATGAQREKIRSLMNEMYDEYRGMIAGMIEAGVSKGEFSPSTNMLAIAAGLMGAIDALGLQYWMDPEFDVREAATETVSAILRGISNAPETRAKG